MGRHGRPGMGAPDVALAGRVAWVVICLALGLAIGSATAQEPKTEITGAEAGDPGAR